MYKTVEEVQDAFTKAELKEMLMKKGIQFHPALGQAKLSKLYFDEQPKVEPEVVIPPPPLKREEGRSEDEWEFLADRIKIDSEVRKDQPTAATAFLGKEFNLNVSPLGHTAGGKKIRFVAGLSTLNIAEQKQQADIFPQELIHFKGVEEKIFEMPMEDGKIFKGRSIMHTTDKTLIEFLTSNRLYGKRYLLYDRQEVNRLKMKAKKKAALLQAAIFNADRQDLICTLAYLDMREGKNTYDSLASNPENSDLQTKCIKYVEKSPEVFLDAMQDKMARIIHLVHLAKARNVINVTSDGTEVTMASNGVRLVSSSLASNWEDDLAGYLIGKDGHMLMTKLEDTLSWKV